MSRRAKASIDWRTISTFSCDMAYSASPTALRACCSEWNICQRAILSRRTVVGHRRLVASEVRVERRLHDLDVLVRNKSLHLEECLLLLVDAGLCPLRGSTQRRSGPVDACQFHPSRVTTVGSSWALLRHRLLLEAEVGEGTVAVHVTDHPHDLAITDVKHPGSLCLDLPEVQPARFAVAAEVVKHHHVLSPKLTILVRRQTEPLPEAKPGAEI